VQLAHLDDERCGYGNFTGFSTSGNSDKCSLIAANARRSSLTAFRASPRRRTPPPVAFAPAHY
jgi:hypothetical protein